MRPIACSHGRPVNTLIAFRCHDGHYVLVPHADAARWFDNDTVDFLGDVKVDSFDIATARSIMKQVVERSFAWVPKERFLFGWSHPQSRAGQAPRHMHALIRTKLHALARKPHPDRAATTR